MKTQSGFYVDCLGESLDQVPVYYHHFSITRIMSGYVSSVSVGFLFHEVMIAKTITDQPFTILLCLKKEKEHDLVPTKPFLLPSGRGILTFIQNLPSQLV